MCWSCSWELTSFMLLCSCGTWLKNNIVSHLAALCCLLWKIINVPYIYCLFKYCMVLLNKLILISLKFVQQTLKLPYWPLIEYNRTMSTLQVCWSTMSNVFDSIITLKLYNNCGSCRWSWYFENMTLESLQCIKST